MSKNVLNTILEPTWANMITNSSEEDIKPPSNLLKDGSTIYPSFCLHAIHTDDGMNFCHPVGSNGAFPKDSRQPTFELEAAPRPGLVAPLTKYEKVQIYIYPTYIVSLWWIWLIYLINIYIYINILLWDFGTLFRARAPTALCIWPVVRMSQDEGTPKSRRKWQIRHLLKTFEGTSYIWHKTMRG